MKSASPVGENYDVGSKGTPERSASRDGEAERLASRHSSRKSASPPVDATDDVGSKHSTQRSASNKDEEDDIRIKTLYEEVCVARRGK